MTNYHYELPSRMEEVPSQNMPVQKLKVAILPLDLPCSGPVTHSGEILTTGKFHGKNFEETSGYVRPERVNKWPNPMTDIWWWQWVIQNAICLNSLFFLQNNGVYSARTEHILVCCMFRSPWPMGSLEGLLQTHFSDQNSFTVQEVSYFVS